MSSPGSVTYWRNRLETAVRGQGAGRNGYNDVMHMKQDTELASMRPREDFKKLVAELEGKRR